MQVARSKIQKMKYWSEKEALEALLADQEVGQDLRKRISNRAATLVKQIREETSPTMMELFLGEYGLSSEEGVALMCLAEALLRVPDGITMDSLIEDKITSSEWDKHLGKSNSSLINASTWALFVTGKVLDDDQFGSAIGIFHNAIKRLGEPVIRQAVIRVMKELGKQFVLGETIESAIDNARPQEKRGYTYSYDMLGEAALTDRDARRYYLSYSEAINQIAKASKGNNIRENPGISIKLSALHPRYELLQKHRVMEELMPRARSLAILAKAAGIGFNIDAEEAGRLDLSLEVIEAILADPSLKGWDGFGVVVQAYGLRAPAVLDWLYELAKTHDRKIMVRLVKGAYWDTEIKHAQVEGLDNFPVFTQKASTDVSYICCARKLLNMTDRIYPQFATHNAHSVAAILEMAGDNRTFEFQRLHGMGEALHETVLAKHSTGCRIYAPVGSHKDLLAYLVRRLLENGANSSFVNQIVDETVPPEEVAADPFMEVLGYAAHPENKNIRQPVDLFLPDRKNSKGWDLEDPLILNQIRETVSNFKTEKWHYGAKTTNPVDIINPANGNSVGTAQFASSEDVDKICENLKPWNNISAHERADILRKAADLYEENTAEIFALLMREAGKTLLDCVGELREAVDFLRYYAKESEKYNSEPAGLFACISPWNFPLAIFTGQISAALAVGNAVIAKPAESTPLVASFAVQLLHEAGVPETALQVVLGTGPEIGDAITSNKKINGICFTGSTTTAQIINQNMSKHLEPHAPLIAETGGLNAMIVDSTALPEQAITDILASAFQSAGQRCSALRVLYLQEDVAETFMEMLYGAMDELKIGDPIEFDTDIGPVIDITAKQKIGAYIEKARTEGKLLKQLNGTEEGHFIGPAVISVRGINELDEEIFGPVLHIATYAPADYEKIIKDINSKGYGLTFGMHSRIDERVQYAVDHVEAGNIYINRNQIGAVVGSQPFGGEGLSGTGPKAGGPKYLKRFMKVAPVNAPFVDGNPVRVEDIHKEFERLEYESGSQLSVNEADAIELPGPTGESNRYSQIARRRVLCLGPTAEQAKAQALEASKVGCVALAITQGVSGGINGIVDPNCLVEIKGLEAVVSCVENLSGYRKALAQREGPIVPLLSGDNFAEWLLNERHICIDTTAAGGNTALLSS